VSGRAMINHAAIINIKCGQAQERTQDVRKDLRADNPDFLLFQRRRRAKKLTLTGLSPTSSFVRPRESNHDWSRGIRGSL